MALPIVSNVYNANPVVRRDKPGRCVEVLVRSMSMHASIKRHRRCPRSITCFTSVFASHLARTKPALQGTAESKTDPHVQVTIDQHKTSRLLGKVTNDSLLSPSSEVSNKQCARLPDTFPRGIAHWFTYVKQRQVSEDVSNRTRGQHDGGGRLGVALDITLISGHMLNSWLSAGSGNCPS